MKSVLISIRPKWVEKIAKGQKTIEVHKSAPKEVPFKAYIYCTIGNGVKGDYLVPSGIQCGKVIGEFVCATVERFSVGSLRSDDIEKLACLSYNEMISYFYKPEELDGNTAKQGLAWHISDLKIYDKPRELSEFGQKCDNANEIRCRDCRLLEEWDNCCSVMCKPLTRAPSNWCYVEELPK